MKKITFEQHKGKTLTFRGEKVKIDEDIAPLISNLWKLGIMTTNSCQGQCSFKCNHKVKVHPKDKKGCTYYESLWTKHCQDNIWIVFEHAVDVEKFYNIVAEYVENDQGTMYHKMRGGGGPRDRWCLNFYPRNLGIQHRVGRPTINGYRSTQLLYIEDGCKKNDFVMMPQLTFPHKHLSYVEERIALAIKKLRK